MFDCNDLWNSLHHDEKVAILSNARIMLDASVINVRNGFLDYSELNALNKLKKYEEEVNEVADLFILEVTDA